MVKLVRVDLILSNNLSLMETTTLLGVGKGVREVHGFKKLWEVLLATITMELVVVVA